MKRFCSLLVVLLSVLLAPASLRAQSSLELPQQSMAKWGVGSAQYSGITPIGNGRYALVSDKERTDGFFIFRIDQNPLTGDVSNVVLEGFRGNASPKVDAQGISVRDCEGVAYFPTANTLFISGEGDQEILEYALETGQPTGRKLAVPEEFSLKKIVPNYGFEALCYDTIRHRFWTITESTLPADGPAASAKHPGVANLLRLQAFDDNLQPTRQYAYRMDAGRTADFGRTYVFGVPEVTALPDGRLLVLEREANVTANGLQSSVYCKLFIVSPDEGKPLNSVSTLSSLSDDMFLPKTLLAAWHTGVRMLRIDFANYEGMCLGQPLPDGRQTLLLINDSQGGYRKGPFSLKDYIKVIVIGN